MKVLFILQSIGYGGSMTSLINLVTLLKDHMEIECDVLIMDPYGELMPEIKKVAHICNRDVQLEAVSLNRKKIGKFRLYGLLIRRFMYWIKGKLQKCSTSEAGYKDSARKYSHLYDCVIAYQESVATNFAVYIKARKHIAWVHNDYRNVLKLYGSRENLQKKYAPYDKIVCVSKTGSDNFKKYSGLDKNKIIYIYNTLLADVLKNKAHMEIREVLLENECNGILTALESNSIKLVSSGRFSEQKRFDRVIDVADILLKKGYKFKWFIIGNGVLFDEIAKKVIERKLEDCVYLTGGLVNPFPIINACDLFVLTSEFEAHPMVANEALILGKPVITTNFESAKEVIKDHKMGIICGMEPNQIAQSIINVLDDEKLYMELCNRAEAFEYSNQEIIAQVLKLIMR